MVFPEILILSLRREIAVNVIIPAGGFGTSIVWESQFKPKPLVESGYSHSGTHNEGARCLWLPCVHHLRRI